MTANAKRIACWSLVVGIGLLAFGAAVPVMFRSPMPSQWHRLHAGMSVQEVLATASGPNITVFDQMLGGLIFTQKTRMLGAPSSWELFVNYDNSFRLTRASARFLSRGWLGLRRSEFQNVL